MHHQQLKNNYVDQSGAYDYQAAVVQGRIDLPQVQRLFPAIAALPETRLTNVIHAPATLHYYHAIGDRTPAYTIEKGTRIRIRLKQLSLPDQVGYGLYSLPTDVAGWRLAVPFHVEHVRAHHPLLYVKQDELLEVARAWVGHNPSLAAQGQQMKWSKPELTRRLTLWVDHQLYDSGVYLSPDLLGPVFPRSSFLLLSLALLTAGLWVMEGIRAKRRTSGGSP